MFQDRIGWATNTASAEVLSLRWSFSRHAATIRRATAQPQPSAPHPAELSQKPRSKGIQRASKNPPLPRLFQISEFPKNEIHCCANKEHKPTFPGSPFLAPGLPTGNSTQNIRYPTSFMATLSTLSHHKAHWWSLVYGHWMCSFSNAVISGKTKCCPSNPKSFGPFGPTGSTPPLSWLLTSPHVVTWPPIRMLQRSTPKLTSKKWFWVEFMGYAGMPQNDLWPSTYIQMMTLIVRIRLVCCSCLM